MATTVGIPVSGTAKPQRQPHGAAPVAVGIALMLAVTIALIFIALGHGVATGSNDPRPGQPVTVPHPTPGPFGS